MIHYFDVQSIIDDVYVCLACNYTVVRYYSTIACNTGI